MKRPSFLISGLILIGLLLRLPSLRLGLWRDEASTYFDVLPTDLGELIKTIINSELNPPGFYLIMHQWMQWFGADEVVFKIPALIFGLLLIPATYALARTASSHGAGLIAATITTFASEAVYYSQEARPYSLAALLCCLVVLLYCKALTSKHQIWYLLGFVFCSSLLLYVQYTGLLLIGSLILTTLYLVWQRTDNVRLLPFGIAFGVIFLSFIPWLPVFLTHLNAGTAWSVKESWLMRTKLFLDNVAYTLPIPIRRGRTPALLLLVGLILGLKAKQFLSRQTGQHSQSWNKLPQRYPVTLGVCFLILAIMLASLSYGGRYMFLFTPIAWAFYGCWLIVLFEYIKHSWARQWLRFVRLGILTLLIIIFFVPNLIYGLSLGNVAKSGIRYLAADMRDKAQDKTIYILNPDYLGPTFGYYFAKQPINFYGFARWDSPEIFRPQGYAKVWDNPTLVSDIETRLQNEIQKKGYQQLALIQDNRGKIGDEAQMKYSKANQFLSRLKKTYSMLEKKDYPGKSEPVTLYRFALKSTN